MILFKLKLFIFLVLFFLFVLPVEAGYFIDYQAKLTDEQGKIVEDGFYHLKFSMWSTKDPSTILWQEEFTNEERAVIENGILKIRLGQKTPFGFLLNENEDYYLSVVVGGKEERPDWTSGLSFLNKIKLKEFKEYKLETIEGKIFKEKDLHKTREVSNFQGEALLSDLATDFLIKSLTTPFNAIDLYDKEGDITISVARGKDLNIVLGSKESSVNILVGNLKIGTAKEELSDFEMKGESLFVSGDVGIKGKTFLGNELFLEGKDIAIKANIPEEAEIGDVIVMEEEESDFQGRVSYFPNARNILGVIPKNSATVLDSSSKGRAVAIAGIVKVKATTENGKIKKGDFLATSSLKGYAMRATLPGVGIIGRALENFDKENGLINVLLQVGSFYTPASRTLIVSKAGGNFSSITEALNSISDASPDSPYIIKVEEGIYEEKIVMKEYVEIIGADSNSVKIINSELPLVELNSNSRLEGFTLEVLKRNKPNKTGIFSVIRFPSTQESKGKTFLSRLKIEGRPERKMLIGIEIEGKEELEISNLEIKNTDEGVIKKGEGELIISHSQIETKNNDIQSIDLGAKIISLYNTLEGKGYNFNIGTETNISSYKDKYINIKEEGKFEILEKSPFEKEGPRLILEQKNNILRLRNIDKDLISINEYGAITITPQNTAGDSFTFLTQTEGVGLSISQIGTGPAARFSGEIIVAPKKGEKEALLTFEGPGVISSGGYPISIGRKGDTVKLNVPGVKYEWPEKIRRNTIFLYLSKPERGEQLLGSKESFWQPEEDIIISKLKLQYKVINQDNNNLQVILNDNTGRSIFDTDLISQQEIGYYQTIKTNPDENYNSISQNKGVYLEIKEAKNIEQLSIEIEYIYQ